MLKIFRESIDIKKRLRDFEEEDVDRSKKRRTAAVATTPLFHLAYTQTCARERGRIAFSVVMHTSS